MFDVVLLDFYGTAVHENEAVVDLICATISQSARAPATPTEVGGYWWAVQVGRTCHGRWGQV